MVRTSKQTFWLACILATLLTYPVLRAYILQFVNAYMNLFSLYLLDPIPAVASKNGLKLILTIKYLVIVPFLPDL